MSSQYWEVPIGESLGPDKNVFTGENTFLDQFNIDEDTDIGDHGAEIGTYDPSSSGTINEDGFVEPATLILNYTNTVGYLHQYVFRIDGDHSVENPNQGGQFLDEYNISLGEDADSTRYRFRVVIAFEPAGGIFPGYYLEELDVFKGPEGSDTRIWSNEEASIRQIVRINRDPDVSPYPIDVRIQIVKNRCIYFKIGDYFALDYAVFDDASIPIHDRAKLVFGPGRIRGLGGFLVQDNVLPHYANNYYSGSEPTAEGDNLRLEGVEDNTLPDDGTAMDCNLQVVPDDITHGGSSNVLSADISYDSTKNNYVVVGNIELAPYYWLWDSSQGEYVGDVNADAMPHYEFGPDSANLWAGVFARMKNSGNYDRYVLRIIGDGVLELAKAYLSGGVLTFDTLASKSGFIFILGEPIELALEVQGDLLQGYYNGNLEFSVRNTELPDAGLMGYMRQGFEESFPHIAEDELRTIQTTQFVDWQPLDDDFTTTGTGDLNITAREFVGLDVRLGYPSKTANISESVAIYEFLPLAEKIRQILEQVGITDVVSLNVTIPITETITINELLRRWDELITLAEEVSIETAIANLIKQFKLGETVSINDAVTLSLLLAIAEQIDITDIIPKSTRKMTDSISIAEVLSAIIQANPNEDVSVGEGIKVIKTNPGGGFEEGEYFKISKQRYFEL